MNNFKMFFKNLIKNIKTHPKQWGASAAGVICVCIFAGIIVKAGVLGNTFNPDMYLNDKNDKNDVSFDSTIYNSKNSDSENSKEMDNNADDDYSVDKKKDTVSIVDHNKADNSNSGDENGSGGYVSGDSGKTIVVVDGDSGNGNGNNQNSSDSGNSGNGGNSGNTTDPSKPSEDENNDWKVTNYNLRPASLNTQTVKFYKYMTVTEQKIKNRLVVTANYENIKDPSQTKSEVVSDYTISTVTGNYLNKEIKDADVGKTFNITITLGGISKTIDCLILEDFICYERFSVDYKDSINFAVGDVIDLNKRQDVIDKIDVTAYGYSYNGLQKLTVYHLQNDPTFSVDFNDENGAENETATISKAVTSANISVKDGLNKTTSAKNIIKYNVFNYKLTVMYNSSTALRTIYQDSPTFDLTKPHDNAISTYNEMIERLKSDGLYKTDSNGFLKTAFYGWSVYLNNTDYRDAITTYSFSGNDHSKVLYPLPLKDIDSNFSIKSEGVEQILVGYSGTGNIMEVPYGVTKIKIDKDFVTTSSAKDIEKIVIPSTVTSIDFSDVLNKFPNLSFYETNGNTVLSNDSNGFLYSNDGKTLLRVPVKTDANISVIPTVTQIANNAFFDSLSTLAKNGEKLVLTMEGINPPQFYLGNSEYQTFKDSIKIKIGDSVNEVTDDYYLKKYTVSYGAMLDNAFGEEGFALSNIIYTEKGAQKKYINIENNVYSKGENSLKLEFADADASGIFSVLNGVTSIGDNAFYDSQNITVVNLPETVKTIETDAFNTSSNKLCGVQITSNQKINIEENILGNYDSTKSNFHIYVSSAEEEESGWLSALSGSYGSENASQILVITDGDFKYIDNCIYLEDSDKNLTLYYAPSSLTEYNAPANLVAIADFAFKDSKLFSISLKNVTEISPNAFENCENLEVLSLPAKELDCKCSFDGCNNLKYVILNENNIKPLKNAEILEGDTYSFEDKIIYQNIGNQNEVVYAVTDISGTVSLKDNTSVIRDFAFADCTKLESLGINRLNLVKVIGEGAFKNCESLGKDGEDLELSATEIGKNAFENCNSIELLRLTKGVETIGERAFSNCDELSYIYWIANTTNVGDYLFENSNNILLLSLGDEDLDVNNENITTIGAHTFENHTSLASVVFHTSITNIEDYAFKGCENMRTSTDTLSDENQATRKIETIGKYTFANCYLVSYLLPEGSEVTSLGEGCFMNCENMVNLTLPDNLKEVPDYAFLGCKTLTKVYTQTSKFERVGKNAFSGCVKLQHFYDTALSTSFKTIDDGAFSETTIDGVYFEPCTSLISFEFPSTMETIGNSAFSGCSLFASVDLSRCSNLTTIGNYAFADCESLTDFDAFNTNISSVSPYMLNGCSNLTSILLPASVTSISNGAFVGCESLETLYLKYSDMVEVENGAFGDTGNNENLVIYIPKTEDSALKKTYVDSAKWEEQLFNRGEEVFTEIDSNYFIRDGGVYESNGDGTYTLISVFPTTEGGMNIYTRTSAIDPNAFDGCSKITMVSIPTTVKEIPNGIFKDCPNVELLIINEINSSGAEVGEHPMIANNGNFFGDSTPNENFRIYVCSGAISQYDNWYNAPVYSFGNTFAFESNVFYGLENTNLSNKYVTLLYIPRSFSGPLTTYNDTREIAESAGEGCTKLESLTLNALCRTVGKRAFKGCTGLKTLYAANTSSVQLTTIEDEAFMNCSSLIGKSDKYPERLYLPISIREIGKRAFMNCTSLTYFSIQGSVADISDECFSGCTKLSTFSGTAAGLASIKRLGKKAFYNCDNLVSLSWTNLTNLEEIDDSAYEDCNNIILATFAGELKRIGDNAFKGTKLQSMTFNGSTPPTLGKDIMDEELQKNMAIYVPTKGEGTKIQETYKNAWMDDYPLLAQSVEGIEGYQFRMVSNVLYLVNPSNEKELSAVKVVKSLSSVSFYNTTSLYCNNILADAVSGCNLIKTITITANIKSIGDRAFKDCTALTTVSTNTILTSIGEEAFKNCISLKAISIPATVTSIGTRAFENNQSLTQFVMRQETPIILSSKIFGDTLPAGLTIYVPEGSLELYKEKWAPVLDSDYGEGTADSIILGY